MTTTASTPGGGRLRDEIRHTVHNDLQIAHDMLSRLGSDVQAGASASAGDLRAMLRQLLRDIRVSRTELDAAASSDRHRLVKTTQQQLVDWRAALDDLRVQSNLGEMASRDRVEQAIGAAERAWSLAQQRLDVARKDLSSSWDAVRDGLNDAMRSLADAVRVAIESLTQSPNQT